MPTDLETALKKASVYLQGEMEKQAQNPLGDLLSSIPDEAKSTLRNALIGGLIGGTGGAMAAGPDNRMKGLLAGTGLGAASGGAGTLGMKLLGGQLQFPGEGGGIPSITGALAGGATGAAAAHPGLTLGTLLGVGGAAKYGPRSSEIYRTLTDLSTKKGPQGKAAARVLARLKHITRPGAMPYLNRAINDVRAPLNYQGPNVFTEFKDLVIDPLRRRGTVPTIPAAQRIRLLRRTLSDAITGAGKSVGSKGSNLASAGRNIASAARINRIISALPQSMKRSRLPWALAPIGAGAGLMLDKYIKGDY
jgi:hypothetical protein